MTTKAQIVCYNFNPVNSTDTSPITPTQAKMHFGTNAKATDVTAKMLHHCTLVYRKALDSAVFKQNNVSIHVTQEGLLVPEKTGEVQFCSNLQSVPEEGKVYYFDKKTPIHVPVLEHFDKTTKKKTYCIDYRPSKKIENLHQNFKDGDKDVYTTDLYASWPQEPTPAGGQQQTLKPYHNYHSEKSADTCIIGMLMPIKDNHIAPLMTNMKPVHVVETVRSKSTLTADGVAAALTHHSVNNIIGIAMQRIATNHQGDIMLHDGI